MKSKRKFYEKQLKNILSKDVFEHSVRVAQMSELLAVIMKFSSEEQELIYIAALHHDVGKAIIDSPIWNKKGNLSKSEFDLAKQHPVESAKYMLRSNDEVLSGLQVYVRHHHENIDGSGYPSGLKGQSIPVQSRIIAFCDALDAMTSIRPYRQFAYTQENALEMLKSKAGAVHDQHVIAAYENNFAWISSTLQGLESGSLKLMTV